MGTSTINTQDIEADSAIAVAMKQEEKLFRLMKRHSLVGTLMSGEYEVGRDKFNGKMTKSTKGNAPIVEKTILEGQVQKGGKMQFRMVDELQEDGVEDRDTLEGTGESLDMYDDELTLKLYRKAVKVDDLSEFFAIDNLSGEHKTALEQWGTDKIDKLAIAAWVDSPTSVYYPDSTAAYKVTKGASFDAAKALLVQEDSLTIALIQYLSTYAKTGGTGADRRFKKITPFAYSGAGVRYALMVHPHAILHLFRDTEYRQEVRERFPNATWVNRAVAIIGDIIIIEDENVPIFENAGPDGDVTGCKAIFTGASSLCLAWGRRPYATKEERDHGMIKEVGWNMIAKFKKFNFKSIDMNSFMVALPMPAITG